MILSAASQPAVDADSGCIYAHYDPGRLTESRIWTAMRREGYWPGPSIAY